MTWCPSWSDSSLGALLVLLHVSSLIIHLIKQKKHATMSYNVNIYLFHWHLSLKPQLISWKHHRHTNEAQNAWKYRKKNKLYKGSVRFYKFLYKIDFCYVFMHFELRWYTDGAFYLLTEVLDSSASDLFPWFTSRDEPSHRHVGLKCYAVVNWCKQPSPL